MNRRSFLAALGLGVVFRPDKWIEKPLPPPESVSESVDFTKVVVPMCFYSHTRKITLVNTISEPDPREFPGAVEEMAKKLAAEIEFDIFREGYTPVA